MVNEFKIFIVALIIFFVYYIDNLESANKKNIIKDYSGIGNRNLTKAIKKNMESLADNPKKESAKDSNNSHEIKIQLQPYYFSEKETIHFLEDKTNKDVTLPLELVNSSIAISILAKINPSLFSLFAFYEPNFAIQQSGSENEKSEKITLKQYSIGGGLEMQTKSVKKLHTTFTIGIGYQNNKINIENESIKKIELENIFLRTEIGLNIEITDAVYLICTLYNDQVLSMQDNMEIYDMHTKFDEENISLKKNKRGIKLGIRYEC
ncbi:hypothetical protein GUI12_03640 [Anaplasmataceae bacterium AB001_6]|nr:hypothetical protein GUI12_03640 [Anaplasmataceae bacterium AB001_6]